MNLEAKALGELQQSWGDKFRQLIVPLSEQELQDALAPHPHIFQSGNVGLLPRRELTVLASTARDGKTTGIVGVAAARAMGHSLGGLCPHGTGSVVIYSAEDDRMQYARKVGAQIKLEVGSRGEAIRQKILVPNLDDLGPGAARCLVMMLEGQPTETTAVDMVIEALQPMMDAPDAPDLLVFETASTLSEADETNPAFRTLVMALRRIARTLDVAVLLSHHVSQASMSNLPDLNISTTDIRGATALVNNARQTAMMVNLGSEADPFPDTDARTVLRRMIAPNAPDRMTAWITLDSSKGVCPPPIFFRWMDTEYGPAAVEVDPPQNLAGRSWRKVKEMLAAERAVQRTEAKAAAASGNLSLVLKLVRRLEESGKQPTVRAVSVEAGKSPGWAKQYLDAAVESGDLTCTVEKIPRMKDGAKVYRSAD